MKVRKIKKRFLSKFNWYLIPRNGGKVRSLAKVLFRKNKKSKFSRCCIVDMCYDQALMCGKVFQ